MKNTPFKMNGFSGFGNSPVKQRPYVNIGSAEVYPEYAGSGVSISGGEGKKPLSTYTLTPGISVGKFNLSGKYKGGFKADETGKSTSKSFLGGTGKFSFGSRNPGTYDPSFKGSISGEYGTTKHPTGKKTTGYSGRASLGIGRSGSFGCQGGYCSGPDVAGYHIKAFGEHGSKGSYNPGTRFGLSGRYGVFTGEGSYDIQTKKPQFKLGIKLPFNK
jgi:hypothetical protein